MKTANCMIGIAIVALVSAGCVVSIGGGGHSRESHTERVVVLPGQEEDHAVAAEIDAVDSLNFEASRLETLKSIAQRPGLSPAAQVHLVNKALSKLGFEASRLQVLETLIQNPSFSNAGKEAILSQLQKLTFESSRTAVLKAINDRGPLNQ